MDKVLEEKLNLVKETLKKSYVYRNACAVLQFDLETICPPKAMEAQGETITVRSDPGENCEFTFTLPLFQNEPNERAKN